LSLTLRGERLIVVDQELFVRAPGIVEDDFHGAAAPGAAEINKLR
jgi:hypothetical protein